jgi:hypothetical protein
MTSIKLRTWTYFIATYTLAVVACIMSYRIFVQSKGTRGNILSVTIFVLADRIGLLLGNVWFAAIISSLLLSLVFVVALWLARKSTPALRFAGILLFLVCGTALLWWGDPSTAFNYNPISR